MVIKPQAFRGTRDFLPEVMFPRAELVARIREVFERYGFGPMETPAIEYLETLSGKYGDEGEKLIYRLAYKGGDVLALRYDLTIPLARVVAQHPHLPKPFKRYQIQPVWRADRPQIHQGRFREFVQCDADIVGVAAPTADAEILMLTVEILRALEVGPFTVRLSHRRLLNALVRQAGIAQDAFGAACRALDKWDKVGPEGVRREMEGAGFETEQIERLLELVGQGEGEGFRDRLERFKEILKSDDEGIAALEDLTLIHDILQAAGLAEAVAFWPSLARGLDYYTGAIFESFHDALPHLGSLTGGGRYDDLIGIFLGERIPATGTTIGIDRILSALEQTGKLERRPSRTEVFVTLFEDQSPADAFALASRLRAEGFRVEVAYEAQRLKKQMAYAHKMGIPVVVLAGPEERERGEVTVKEMASGAQERVPVAELSAHLRRLLQEKPAGNP
jgi:histidyl-tRNA synthetase